MSVKFCCYAVQSHDCEQAIPIVNNESDVSNDGLFRVLHIVDGDNGQPVGFARIQLALFPSAVPEATETHPGLCILQLVWVREGAAAPKGSLYDVHINIDLIHLHKLMLFHRRSILQKEM